MDLALFAVGCAILVLLLRILEVVRKSAEKREQILEQSGLHLLEINERLRWLYDRLDQKGGPTR